MRFIVGILWIILLVFIILVFLNMPGVRKFTGLIEEPYVGRGSLGAHL